jgi:hypothetical protein
MKYLYNIIHNTKILQLFIIFTLFNVGCTSLRDELSIFLKNKDYLYRIKVDDKYGYINSKGRIITKPIFEHAPEFLNKNEPFITYTDGKCSYTKYNGKQITERYFDVREKFSEGLAPVNVSSKWGIINTQGKFILEPIYNHIYAYSHGLAATRID